MSLGMATITSYLRLDSALVMRWEHNYRENDWREWCHVPTPDEWLQEGHPFLEAAIKLSRLTRL